MLVSSTVAAVGDGLYTRLAPDTSTGEWIGYQVLAASGRGLMIQVVCTLSLSAIVAHHGPTLAMWPVESVAGADSLPA